MMRRKLKGYRTFLIFLPMLVFGVLDQLGTIDIKTALEYLGVDPGRSGGLVAFLSLIALILRIATTTPVTWRDQPEDQ